MILLAALPVAVVLAAAWLFPLPAVCGDIPYSTAESTGIYRNPICNSIVKILEARLAGIPAGFKTCPPLVSGDGNMSPASVKASANNSGGCAQYNRKIALAKAELLRIREMCAKGLVPGSQPGAAATPGAATPSGAYKLPLKLPGGGVRNLKSGGPGIKITGTPPPAVALAGTDPGEPYVELPVPGRQKSGLDVSGCL